MTRVPTSALLLVQVLLGVLMAAGAILAGTYGVLAVLASSADGLWVVAAGGLVVVLVALAVAVVLDREVRERERDRELLARFIPAAARPAQHWLPQLDDPGWDAMLHDVSRSRYTDVWHGAR